MNQLILIPNRSFSFGSSTSNTIDLMSIKTSISISSAFDFLQTVIDIWMEYFDQTVLISKRLLFLITPMMLMCYVVLQRVTAEMQAVLRESELIHREKKSRQRYEKKD